MLKEKIEQVKVFVADHKKEIAIGLCVAVGGTVLYKVVKVKPKIENVTGTMFCNVDKYLEIPKLDVGTITELWEEDGYKNLFLNDITVADMGKIGEELLKIDGVTNKTCVTAVVGLLDEVENVTEF